MKRKGRLYFNGPRRIRHFERDLDYYYEAGLNCKYDILRMRIDMMKQIRTQDTRAKFHNSVADLKDIQSKFDELEASINKERARVAVLYGPTKSLNDGLKAKMYEETASVEANYHNLCEQLYTKRFKIVNGVVPTKNPLIHEAMRSSLEDILEAFEDTIKNKGVPNFWLNVLKVKPEAMRSAFEDTIKNKGVPNFWLTVMKAKPVLCEEINGRDEEVLKFLKDIKLCKVDNPKGFKLEFDFAENPFFQNEVLTKTYHMVDEDYVMPVAVIGTNIEWYVDRRLAEPVLVPSETSKSCSRVAVGCESFFNFFDAPVNFKDAEDCHVWMQHDYEIRCALQDIIHGAISYFLEKTPDFPIKKDKLKYESYQNRELVNEDDDPDESFYEFDCQIGKV